MLEVEIEKTLPDFTLRASFTVRPVNSWCWPGLRAWEKPPSSSAWPVCSGRTAAASCWKGGCSSAPRRG